MLIFMIGIIIVCIAELGIIIWQRQDNLKYKECNIHMVKRIRQLTRACDNLSNEYIDILCGDRADKLTHFGEFSKNTKSGRDQIGRDKNNGWTR